MHVDTYMPNLFQVYVLLIYNIILRLLTVQIAASTLFGISKYLTLLSMIFSCKQIYTNLSEIKKKSVNCQSLNNAHKEEEILFDIFDSRIVVYCVLHRKWNKRLELSGDTKLIIVLLHRNPEELLFCLIIVLNSKCTSKCQIIVVINWH